jgi:signal transduction histidine kinase
MLAGRLPEHDRDHHLAIIHQEAQRLSALIDDFLDLQRLEAGGAQLAAEPFPVADVLREQVELFTGHSTEHELKLDLPEEPLVIRGERDRIAQVLVNLLSNAIKYSPHGGPVDVQACRVNGSVAVTVTDSGLGIPTAQQAHVFQKFFRVDTSAAREIRGTGLGLALVKEIVEAHSGTVGFDSVEGHGSRFWFKLPAD